MAEEGKCGHEICVCRVAEEDEYCSDHCRDASDQDMTEIACDCRHSACSI